MLRLTVIPGRFFLFCTPMYNPQNFRGISGDPDLSSAMALACSVLKARIINGGRPPLAVGVTEMMLAVVTSPLRIASALMLR